MLSSYTSIGLSLCTATGILDVALPQSFSEVKSNFWYHCVLHSLGQQLVLGFMRLLLGAMLFPFYESLCTMQY